MKNQTVRFWYRTIWKKLNTSKKTRSVSQKKNKSKYSCRTIFTPTNKVQDDGTECPFFTNLDFSTFFTDFCSRRFRCTISFILKQKTLQRLLFFFWGNLVSGIPMGYAFSASVSKNFTSLLFMGYQPKYQLFVKK